MAKKKKRVDLDVRPISPWWSNYDYGGPEEGESEVSPGRGLYNGSMSEKVKQYRDTKGFIEESRKRIRKKRKQALIWLNNQILKKLAQNDQ